jgi:hydroxymethylpyrimidine pyrophosphatase-like HAD family hydrolase
MNITNPKPLYVFDLDGVITHPHDSSIDTQSINHIHTLLRQDTYVAVNTGRSYQWVKDNFITPLESAGAAPQFDHLFIACEKGGESVQWIDNTFTPQPSRFALTRDRRQQVKRFFEANISQFPTMFWDATKVTMTSIEKYPQADLRLFQTQQRQLVNALRELLADADVRIDATTIATDVESPRAGKHAGAELIHEWVTAHRGFHRKHYISFGDSKSDYEMARYFADNADESTFVFVGAKHETFDEHADVQLVRTDLTYANGMNEYFASKG